MSGDLNPLLLRWFEIAKRDMPWRRTQDPYAIWVSEIMLQQTQVSTIRAYFERWMARFPTVQALAEADEQEVLSVWQGLGYYRRCRMMLQAAQLLCVSVPQTYAEWLELPGVGRYTAAAVSSIAFRDAVPSVDGNFERVFARLTGNGSAKPALTQQAWTWGLKSISEHNPGDWNQAMMELGATLCKPKDPACNSCPLQDMCVARLTGQIDKLPRPAERATIRNLTHLTWIPIHDGQYGVRQIEGGEWWEGMWEFPRVSMANYGQAETELRHLVGAGWVQDAGEVRHAVTRNRICLRVEVVRCEQASGSLTWHTLEELKQIPMPAPQRKALRLASPLLD